jgi:hypothetical protein
VYVSNGDLNAYAVMAAVNFMLDLKTSGLCCNVPNAKVQ